MVEDKSIPPRRSRKKPRRFWPIFLLIACFFASAAAGALFASNTLKNLPNTDRQIADVIEQDQLLKVSDKTTVLIMGVDERKDDVGRSDTIIVATIDPITNQAALLSIPRDTRVKLGGYRGFDKINAAYAYGGVRLAESTVENFLGIDIDHYVIINTHAFVDLVDAIGGVDIDVEKRMYYEDPWDDDGGLVIDLYPGYQHLDGADAVTYVRYRDSEGDIGRVKRQQKFISAVVDKLTSPKIIPKVPTLIKEMIDAVNTDLSMRQILELAGSLNDAYKNGIEMDMVPGAPLYIDDVSYWIPDVEMVRLSVADTLGIEVDPFLRERMRDAASEYQSSIPDRASRADDDNPVGRPYSSRDRSESNDRSEWSDRSDRSDYDERTERVERIDRSYDERNYSDRGYEDSRSESRAETYSDRSNERTYEDRSTTERSYDDRSTTDRSYDDRSTTDQTYNDRSYSDRSYDDRSYDDRGYDDRNYNDRSYNDRGYDDRSYEDRSYSDRSVDRTFDEDDEVRAPSPSDYRR